MICALGFRGADACFEDGFGFGDELAVEIDCVGGGVGVVGAEDVGGGLGVVGVHGVGVGLGFA